MNFKKYFFQILYISSLIVLIYSSILYALTLFNWIDTENSWESKNVFFGVLFSSALTIFSWIKTKKSNEKIENNKNFIEKTSIANKGLYKILRHEDIINLGLEKDLLDKLINIDYQTFEDLPKELEGNSKQWTPIFLEHPKTWALLANNNNEILGFWNILPFSKSLFNKAKNGELIDSKIKIKDIEDLDIPQTYKLYLMSFSILSEARREGFKILLNSLAHDIFKLSEEGIFFDEMCMNAITPKGKKLAKGLGLKSVKKHKILGNIYVGNYLDFIQSNFFQIYKNLKENYQNKFST